MTESPSGSWTEHTSGRERIRHVVELLDGPITVQEIAERADVSRTTADDELERLASDDWVTETTVDGAKAYDLNPVRMLFDEITNLIENNTRKELEGRLVVLTEEKEELADEYEVRSLSELRQQLVEEDLSADALGERQDVIATWETLEAEIGLVKHALQLYVDVVELGSSNEGTTSGLQV